MRNFFIILLALGGLPGLTGCGTMAPETSKSPVQITGAKMFQRQLPPGGRTDYLLRLPQDYRPGGAHRWPLILFLHGSGERGTE